jgi:hypothetical protein
VWSSSMAVVVGCTAVFHPLAVVVGELGACGVSA